jgi:hypothetical protein
VFAGRALSIEQETECWSSCPTLEKGMAIVCFNVSMSCMPYAYFFAQHAICTQPFSDTNQRLEAPIPWSNSMIHPPRRSIQKLIISGTRMPMPISPGTRLLDAGLPSKGGLNPLCSSPGVSRAPLPCSLKLRFGDLQTMHTPSKTLQTCV